MLTRESPLMPPKCLLMLNRTGYPVVHWSRSKSVA
jgi:hypothetical protein